MKISKKRLQEIVAEELKIMNEGKLTPIDELCQYIRSFLNEAKAKDKDIVNSPKFKMLENIISRGEKK